VKIIKFFEGLVWLIQKKFNDLQPKAVKLQ